MLLFLLALVAPLAIGFAVYDGFSNDDGEDDEGDPAETAFTRLVATATIFWKVAVQLTRFAVRLATTRSGGVKAMICSAEAKASI